VKDTICAISTPPGIGGIAVLRVSGQEAKAIVSRILKSHKKTFEHGKFFHTYIRDPGTDEVVEEAIISYFQSPNSFTGEDVIEISVHGGLYSPQVVLDLLIKNGARLAEPGEFTKRAFLNGKMDLLQVQALLDLIKAHSELQIKFAISKLRGDLSKKLSQARDLLFELIKETEARVEFEEDIPPIELPEIERALKEIISNLDRLLEEGERNALVFEGVQVVIAGKPNVGKSSLFNQLVRMERAIVTPVPGTTRDLIHEEFFLDGIPVRLYDTAGLRKVSEPVESIGVRKAEEIINNAHFVLFLIDSSSPLTDEDITLWKNLKKDRITVINKIDLGEKVNIDTLENSDKYPTVKVSCLTGQGIHSLEETMKEYVKKYLVPASEISLSKRERHLLRAMKNELSEALENLNTVPLDIISFYLQNAFNYINEIYGWGDMPDRVLNSIFNEFCVGK